MTLIFPFKSFSHQIPDLLSSQPKEDRLEAAEDDGEEGGGGGIEVADGGLELGRLAEEGGQRAGLKFSKSHSPTTATGTREKSI